MMKFRENEEAVSPVIGVILMVAITVILAAVIAAFVFGMTGNIETQKSVALTAKQISGDRLQVTIQSGADLSTLEYLRIEVTDSEGTPETYCAYVTGSGKTFTSGGEPTNGDTTDPITVGSIFTSGDNALTDGSDHVVIIGHFADGRDQMLLDTFL
ncbi:type IV pilin N-terminal domain-containing protein [Methanoculleus sp.]|uniref:type IV pilin N-terminal domain-containing protein n=1 Tax=Methanoculleus sp. TaxID=90427 RepID=UPI00262C6528|nr:type IV pilin N-terminal domain-containing protein [Methanoculleus sp.]MDI6867662.1 type IV pilin N-terminal domain-containing protein [Methanoculleus sp.]